MISLANLNNLNSFGKSSPSKPWYTNPDYALNSVMPSLIYDFGQQRYFDSVSGAQNFPITFSRASNATMFDAQGRLVWAPANMITNACSFSTPTWSSNQATANIDAAVSSPFGTVVRKLVTTAGQVTTGNDGVGGISLGTVTVVARQSYHFCFYAKAGETNFIKVRENITTGARARIDLTNGTIVTESGVTNNAVTGINVSTQDAGDGWRRIIVQRVPVGTTMAFAIKGGLDTGDGVTGSYITYSSLEPTGIDSPKPFSNALNTTGAAFYGPRFDYDPATLAPLGLRVEEARTNLVIFSETLTDASITKIGATISGSTLSPSRNTANRVQEDALLSEHYVSRESMTTTASSAVTGSVFVKADQRTRVVVNLVCTTAADTAQATFDLTTGVISAVGSGGGVTSPAATIQDVGDGWWRCQLSAVTDAGTVTSLRVKLDDGTSTNYTGNGTSGLYVWGLQLEQGAVSTSYIPTSGTATTRSADIPNMALDGWFTSTSGTFYVEAAKSGLANTIYIEGYNSAGLALSGLSLTNPAIVLSGGARAIVRHGTVRGDGASATVVPVGGNLKIAATFGDVAYNATVNGASILTGVPPTQIDWTNRLAIGYRASGTLYANSCIKEIRFYQTLPSATQLQALTA